MVRHSAESETAKQDIGKSEATGLGKSQRIIGSEATKATTRQQISFEIGVVAERG
jgi:hypothetical protein